MCHQHYLAKENVKYYIEKIDNNQFKLYSNKTLTTVVDITSAHTSEQTDNILTHAKVESVAVIDGDGQMPFEDVIHVYRKLRDEDLDLVKTYRTERGDGFYRKTISIVYNIIFKKYCFFIY
mgnify:CR=1 FL=1